jgi:hypothetical protein
LEICGKSLVLYSYTGSLQESGQDYVDLFYRVAMKITDFFKKRQKSAIYAKPLSKPEEFSPFTELSHQYIALPSDMPFEMFRVYRFLRDNFADISDAIWTWKYLCYSGYEVQVNNSEQAERALAMFGKQVDMDGILDRLYTSLFTYGACAMEAVLSNDRSRVAGVVIVDVETVRFRRDPKTYELIPYQVIYGESVRLNPHTFFYYGIERDGTNPYGRSILRALPWIIKIQQKLIEDMQKASHNSGYNRLHISYTPEKAQAGEPEGDYENRIRGSFESLKSSLEGIEVDQNILTTDSVKVATIGGQRSGSGQNFYNNLKAIEEQVITGVHLMPILMGRNYGSTETYGTAQYEIINRNVLNINRGVRRLLESLFSLYVTIHHHRLAVKVVIKQNQTVDLLQEMKVETMKLDNILRVLDKKLLDEDQAREMIRSIHYC